VVVVFFFQAEDGIRDWSVTGVQTCALPISPVTALPGVKRAAVLSSSCPVGWAAAAGRAARCADGTRRLYKRSVWRERAAGVCSLAPTPGFLDRAQGQS